MRRERATPARPPAPDRTPAPSTETALARVRKSTAREFRADPVEVGEAAARLAEAISGLGSVSIIGECRNPGFRWGAFRFDVCDEDGGWLPVAIDRETHLRLRSAYGPDYARSITDGTVLAVSGVFAPALDRGQVEIRATTLSPVRYERAGASYRRRAEARAELDARARRDARVRARAAASPERVHWSSASALAERLSDAGVAIERVVAIRPQASETQREFRAGFASCGVELVDLPMRLDASNIAAALDDAVDDGRTIIAIHRGGGHWTTRDVFDDPEVVRAVLDCRVPVVTGIGHQEDVTLADRAALMSTSTPTALGRLIGGAWRIQHGEREPRSADELAARLDVDARSQLEHRIRDARRAAMWRVRLRSLAVALVWAAGIVCFGEIALGPLPGLAAWLASIGVTGDSTGFGLLGVVVCATAGVFVLRGPVRASRGAAGSNRLASFGAPGLARRLARVERGSEAWFAVARRVSTPRAFRVVFAE